MTNLQIWPNKVYNDLYNKLPFLIGLSWIAKENKKLGRHLLLCWHSFVEPENENYMEFAISEATSDINIYIYIY